jgi:hypothetical protein
LHKSPIILGKCHKAKLLSSLAFNFDIWQILTVLLEMGFSDGFCRREAMPMRLATRGHDTNCLTEDRHIRVPGRLFSGLSAQWRTE